MPRVLCAPDSFKGTLTAAEVAEAMSRGAEAAGWTADRCPLADGGEGTAAVLLAALGGERVPERATDPLGRPIEAEWTLLGDSQTAVVEVAAASGLWLLSPAERDPLSATSFGTGELIAAASRRAQRILVAVGGSATNDGGRGALDAIARAGGTGEAELVCLCDVTTAWEDASRTFGPQKGAQPEEVAELERRLDALARELPRDPRGVNGTGAAGGLAGGLWAALGAQLRPGAAYVCDAVDLGERVAAAGFVIGGEGKLDETTLAGKVLAELARRAADAAKPVGAIVGRDASTEQVRCALALTSVAEAGDAEAIARAAAAMLG